MGLTFHRSCKRLSALLLVLSVVYLAQAQSDYTIYNEGAASATNPNPVKMKTTTTGATTPKVLAITFEYTFSAAATGTADDRDLLICCVTSGSSSTDNLVKFAVDKCFSSQIIIVTSGVDAATKAKHIFSSGIKSTTNYLPSVFYGTGGATGANIQAPAGGVITSAAYTMDSAELAAIGLITSVPGTLTYSCNRKTNHATDNTLVAATAKAIPTTGAATFTVTGTGTACSASNTSKSGSVLTGVASATILASIVALLALDF